MTPKELLEKHGGDPLAAAGRVATVKTVICEALWPDVHTNRYSWPAVPDLVDAVIADLGEDGAEKWGRALWAVVLWAGLDTRFTFAEFWELYKPFNALHFDGFTQITRIANASDRERLAACIVALAEGLQRNTI